MKVYLIVAKGKHQGMPIRIKVDLFLMGSDKMCQLRSQLGGIAPQHCALVMREKKIFIRNLGEGKTFINKEMIPAGDEWPIHSGDRLTVGPLEFLVQFHERQLSQRDAEEWALKSLDADSEREIKEMAEEEMDESLPHAARPPATASAAAASILDKLQMQRGVVKGRMRVSEHEGVTTIRFNDVYMVEEAEIAFIKRELNASLSRQNMRVLLDFKNVKRMSSTAAQMIQEIYRKVHGQAGSMALCRVRPEIHGIMSTLGIFHDMRYFKDKKEALDQRW